VRQASALVREGGTWHLVDKEDERKKALMFFVQVHRVIIHGSTKTKLAQV